MIKWIALALGLTIATSGFAEETGAVEGTLDGENVVLELLGSQSDHRGDANSGSVSLVFSADGVAGIKLIFVGFEIRDGVAAVPDIRMLAEDRSMYFPREDDFTLEVTSAEKSGEFLNLSGRFKFDADISKDFGRTLDPSDSHQIEGTFTAVVGPV